MRSALIKAHSCSSERIISISLTSVSDKQPPTNGCPVSHNESSYENGTSGPAINNTGPGNKKIGRVILHESFIS